MSIFNSNYSGVPTLVVEVMSEATFDKNNVTKLELYMCIGVREYRLVCTEAEELYIYVLKEKRIRQAEDRPDNTFQYNID